MKYHRDISHILRPIVIVLSLFLLYQVWLKPTYFSPPPSPVTDAPAPALSSPVTLSAPDSLGPSEVPPIRLIDPGDAPSVQLSQIREDLDRGNYKTVEASLRKLSKQALKTEPARHYAAALWNNLGIQQEKFGGIAISVKAFKQAVTLNPKNSIALINLTQAYWGLRDPSLTPEFLQTVIRHAPNDPFPHLALADIFLERGNAIGAAEQLKTVETQTKGDPNLRPYFQQLASRIPLATAVPPPIAQQKPASATSPAAFTQTMPQVSAPPPSSAQSRTVRPAMPPAPQPEAPAKSFSPPSTDHFIVRFDGSAAPDVWTQIRSILEYAHHDMTHKFGHTPSSPIQVVLHTGQPFPAEVGTPAPADLLFDATATTIHIPTINAMEDLALLSRVVRHEFAHALIQEKMGAQKQALPTWLTEGLAIHLAEDPWPDLDDMKEKSGTLIALPALQGRWDQIPKDKLAVAYFESALASQNLIDRYGIYGVRQIMNGLLAGLAFETAMQQKLSTPYQDFVRRWEEGALTAGLQKQ